MTLEEAYEKNEKLLWRLAWSWNRTTGINLEELHAEVCLAFCEAWPRYNPDRAAETTFIVCSVQNHLSRFLQLKNRFDEREFVQERCDSPDRFSRLSEMISCLRKDAKDIVMTLLNSPAEIFGEGDKTAFQMRKEVKQYLENVLSARRAQWVFNEIKKAVSEHL